MKKIIIGENEQRVLPIIWLGEETELTYNIYLDGAGARINLLALLLGKGLKKLDLKIKIYHLKPETESRVIIKGALYDSSSIDLEGLVKIEKGAKNTNAWLSAHILLLSDKARGRAVPSMEISENDIKAGHAATVGKVDDLELFYLMSRGLPKKTAKSLIVRGFFDSIVKEFPKNDRTNLIDYLQNKITL